MKLLNNYKYLNKQFILTHRDLINFTKAKSDRLRAIRCSLLASKSQHTFSAIDYRKSINFDLASQNIFIYLNSLFYGSCHDIAFFMSYLLSVNGLKSRLIHLTSDKKINGKQLTHVCVEVFYDKSWHYFDPTLNLFFCKKNSKNILSLEEIRNNSSLRPNKKISLNKLKNGSKSSVYYYKNLDVFNKPEDYYHSFFYDRSYFEIDKKDFAYKAKYMKRYGLVEFYSFREPIFYDKKFKIKKSSKGLGLIESKLVNSNKFHKFQNFEFIKSVNDNYYKLNDFPFLILDIKIKFKEINKKSYILINGKKYSFLSSGKWLFKNNLTKIHETHSPIRSFYVKSISNMASINVLFLKSQALL